MNKKIPRMSRNIMSFLELITLLGPVTVSIVNSNIYCLNSCVMFCTWTGYPHIDLKFRVNVRWCFPPGKQVIQVNYINQSNSVSGNLLPTISSKTSITYTSLLRRKDPKANYFSLVQWKLQRHDQIRLSLLMLVMHSFIHVFQLGFLDFLVR